MIGIYFDGNDLIIDQYVSRNCEIPKAVKLASREIDSLLESGELPRDQRIDLRIACAKHEIVAVLVAKLIANGGYQLITVNQYYSSKYLVIYSELPDVNIGDLI